MKLLIATRNEGKRREFSMMLEDVLPEGVTFEDVASWSEELPEVVEDRDTFVGNAIKKAVEMSQAAGVCAMSEDSGLVVDALGGRPGVHSARFAGEDATDARNNALLVSKLAALDLTQQQQTARYVSVVCLSLIEGDGALGDALIQKLGGADEIGDTTPEQPGQMGRSEDRVVVWWRGTLEGQILLESRGDGGFGYDPHFLVPHLQKTTAELSPEQKNAISHRGEALAAMAATLAA